ncbi:MULTISPECIES: hypothetical protein [unclassified Acidiphilium]|uniref:hypothetical protein n=1 Tax=unclassified Acidiphilium TaxID=2617493 RepID=UPI0025BD337E|nr:MULTISPECIES: hypothetical protein [unclassified Acidiphilium]HQT60576.1 hypothetical protein [Acidiphilium sp.]
MKQKTRILFGISSALIFSVAAHAGNQSIENYISLAASQNNARSIHNFSNDGGVNIAGQWHFIASAVSSRSFNESAGIGTSSQNAGANSVLQNAVSLAYITSCGICVGPTIGGHGVVIGAASNMAIAAGNHDYPGYGQANPASSGGQPGNNGGSGTGTGSSGGTGSGTGTGTGGGTGSGTSTGSSGGTGSGTGTGSSGGTGSGTGTGSSGGTGSGTGTGSSGGTGSGTSTGSSGGTGSGTGTGSSGGTGSGTGTGSNTQSGGTPASYGLTAQGSDPFATVSQSFNNDVGIFSINQNGGANSTVQTATTVAALQTKGSIGAAAAAASARNSAHARRNTSYSIDTPTTSTVQNSMDHSTGVLSIAQNTGSNSIVQNATSVSSIGMQKANTQMLAMTAAASFNQASVRGNYASSIDQTNGVSMDQSFNGTSGVLMAAQNAGANSIIQNSVSVASIRP